MQYTGPLLQTILWVGLIGGIFWRFQLPIHNLLTALADRVKGGSDVKAGPFALTGNVHAQPASQQVARAQEEIAEAFEAVSQEFGPSLTSSVSPNALVPPPPPLPSPLTPTPQFRANYFLAEDLAMRAIQAEYNEPISRQVTAGLNQGFDGAFVRDGVLNVVEVKYSAVNRAVQHARNSIERIAQSLSRNNWKSARLVLAIVIDDPLSVNKTRKSLEPLSWSSSIPVEIHVYSMRELESKFGIAEME